MGKTGLGDIIGAVFQASVLAPQHAAATATEVVPIFAVRQDCRIRRVTFTPAAAVTGDDTNRTNLNLQDRGAAGVGTTEIANLDLATSTDLVATKEQVVYEPDDPYALDAGKVLAVQYEKVASGVLVPQGVWTVEFDLNRG